MFPLLNSTPHQGALLLLLARQRVALRTAEFDEALHPRDDKGKFSGGGGGTSSVKVVSKAATTEQIKQIVAMKKAGKSAAEIQAATGVGPAQSANIYAKHANAEKAITEWVTNKPDLTGFSGKASLKQDSDTKKWVVTDSKGKVIFEKESKGMAQAHMDLYNNKSFAAKTLDVAAKLSPQTKAEAAKAAGYVWQEKTPLNSPGLQPSNVGKYAYFKDGKQASAPFAQHEHEKAAETINQGKGLNPPKETSSFSPIKSSYTSKPEPPAISVEKGVGSTGQWPIKDDVPRTLGKTTPAELGASSSKWAAKLTESEKSQVANYTSSGYIHINSELRANPETLSKEAQHIASALAKSPNPPPPELVWRGTEHSASVSIASTLHAGDVIQLNGFQSTSIKPEFAHNWGSGHLTFEIKPSKGAYVHAVSSHKHEYEYLLPHAAKYTVAGVKNVTLGGYKTKVVQLEMHP